MTNVWEGPDGEGCIRPLIRFPFPNKPRPWIPDGLDGGCTCEISEIGNDAATALARMEAGERKKQLESLIQIGAENRGLLVAPEAIVDFAEIIAAQLDEKRLNKVMAAGDPPKRKISLNLKTDGQKISGGITVSWSF